MLTISFNLCSTSHKYTYLTHHPFNEYDQQNSSQTSSSQSTIDDSTKKQLADIESSIKQNREKTIKKVVDRVLQCDPQLHPNLKKVQA
jgi:V-type H+-transporting ATPase subunit G